MDTDSPFSSLLSALDQVADPLAAFGRQIAGGPAILNVVANLNREQLDAGIRSDGSSISPDYKPLTVYLKTEKGQPTDRVTLHDTGEFYADLYGEAEADGIVLRDKNEKTPDLLEKYGEDVLGITDEGETRITELLLPIFEGHARQQILPQLLQR